MQQDKIAHFITGAIGAFVLTFFMIQTKHDPASACLLSAAFVSAVGILHELAQKATRRGVFDVMDAVYTSGGSLLGAFIYYFIFVI